MGRRSFSTTWLVLFVGFLAVSLAPSCAAAEIQTRATEWSFRLLLLSGVTGAESLAFDARGQGPYAGVSIRRPRPQVGRQRRRLDHLRPPRQLQEAPAVHHARCTVGGDGEPVCGRPLGLVFHRSSGDLYITEAYKGLVPDGGEAEVLATGVDGVPFNFVNGIDVDQATGDVYFTDSSLTYPRRFNTEIMMNADATGRLLKYDAGTKQVTVLKDGLPYPNGVAVSHDRTYIVVAHTVPCQAHRYYLEGPKAGQYELMADLPGYPDNVRRDGKGGFWVALNQEKARPNATATPVKHLVGVRLDGHGVEVEELTAATGVTLSEVTQRNGTLWLGSVELDYVGLVA
ncbi:hypothetical protein QYE76_025606 [Lolium multiflorum]|uniref:Strictosidine synthase conserved region domain-containing protein n=1 Tax=Lolium multiflorum TaxID=4521 RepID=A0AAD8VUS8_LOLMU|nr:hypothetical protein QYE76_025606 [Lolium multiflorum]